MSQRVMQKQGLFQQQKRAMTHHQYALFTVESTKSEKGMSLIGKDSACHIDPIHVENPDVSGAGDTVVATLASCLALGFDVNESAKIANIAASIVVAKPGTATIFLNELNLALR